jgi:hypothetical protein
MANCGKHLQPQLRTARFWRSSKVVNSLHGGRSDHCELGCRRRGGGHNGLACAVYLAKAGWDVIVLERNREVGGAVRSAEITQPGFVHDLFAMNQNLFRGSPIYRDFRNDLERHGLRYIVSLLWARIAGYVGHNFKKLAPVGNGFVAPAPASAIVIPVASATESTSRIASSCHSDRPTIQSQRLGRNCGSQRQERACAGRCRKR